jgi:hypothetical protein
VLLAVKVYATTTSALWPSPRHLARSAWAFQMEHPSDPSYGHNKHARGGPSASPCSYNSRYEGGPFKNRPPALSARSDRSWHSPAPSSFGEKAVTFGTRQSQAAFVSETSAAKDVPTFVMAEPTASRFFETWPLPILPAAVSTCWTEASRASTWGL